MLKQACNKASNSYLAYFADRFLNRQIGLSKNKTSIKSKITIRTIVYFAASKTKLFMLYFKKHMYEKELMQKKYHVDD